MLSHHDEVRFREFVWNIVLPAAGLAQYGQDTDDELTIVIPVDQSRTWRLSFSIMGDIYEGAALLDGRLAIAYHPIEQIWVQLSGTSSEQTVSRGLAQFKDRSDSWTLDLQAPSPAQVGSVARAINLAMEWAKSITNAKDVYDELLLTRNLAGRGSTLMLIAATMVGLPGVEALLTDLTRPAWRTTSQGASAEISRVNRHQRLVIARYHELYDDNYRREIEPVRVAVEQHGAKVPRLSDITLRTDIAPEVAEELVAWIGRLTYVPAKRDLLFALGAPWTPPDTAIRLAAIFRELATVKTPISLLVAASESFLDIADDSAFDVAATIAGSQKYRELRVPFVRSLGGMLGRASEAGECLVSLVGDPQVQIVAVEALGNLGHMAALPVLLPLLEHTDPVLRGRVQTAINRLMVKN